MKLNIRIVKYPTNLLLKLCIAVGTATTAIKYTLTYYMLCTYIPYTIIYIYIYVLVKAPPRVCMKNKARGGVSRDKYSMRRSRVLYLSRDTPRVLYFSYQRAKGVL